MKTIVKWRMMDLEWHLRANCRGMPTDIFFASEGQRGERRVAYEETAKKICRSCAVRRECLQYAVTSVEQWGIWGATTPRERQRMEVWQDQPRKATAKPRKPV